MTSTTSAAQIKRYIGKDAVLALTEIDGTIWASNRYWLTRAEYIAPFLDEHGIKGPGVWHIDGRDIWHDQADPPNRLMQPVLNLANYTMPLKDATLGDWDEIHTPGPDGHYSKLLTTSTGRKVVAVRADWLYWLESAPPGNRERIYSMRLAISKRRRSPVAIIADPLAPEPGDDASPEIVAVVMPVLTGQPGDAVPVPG